MRRASLWVAASAMLGASAPALAEPHTQLQPYLEVSQIVMADLKGGDNDVLTYTSAAAGLDARISTRDAEGQADVRYEHRFGWNQSLGDQDVLSGLARARANIVRDELTIEGGAIATRVRSDLNGANGLLSPDIGNTSDVYSAYLGPTLATRLGNLNVNGAYRLAWNKIDNNFGSGAFAGNAFDESLHHLATASVGQQPGPLPVGWSVSGAWEREDVKQLDQRYNDKFVRADLTVPVSPTLAAVGGAGYEDMDISQRDALLDANGALVTNGNGRLVTDKASPRRLVYDFDGLIWDVGVLWKPSRRTSLDARIGERYGSFRFIGSFAWQPDRNSSVNISVYDGIDSFGRLLDGTVAGLSTNFDVSRNPFTGDISGCAFSPQGGGQCFNDALLALSAANFRHRGINAQWSAERGLWHWGVGAGYARRRFIAPQTGPLSGINGATDENYYMAVLLGRKIDERSGIDANIYANYYDGGFAGSVDVLNVGAYANYYRNFTRRLTGSASVGVDGVDPEGLQSLISALAQIGLRYQF